MFTRESGSQELAVNYKSSFGNPSAFLKAGARITILSVLSRQVKNQTAILRNKEHSNIVKVFPEIEPTLSDNQGNSLRDHSMSSTSVLPVQSDANSHMVNDEAIVVDGDNEENEGSMRIPNGISGPNKNNHDENDNGVPLKSPSRTEPAVSKDCNNVKAKYGRSCKNGKTPFDFMKERKLSEPVMSPRKRSGLTSSKLSRCSSSADLRDNEKPVLRELGGYKFFQKPSEVSTKTPNRKTSSYRTNENQTNEITELKNTIAEQKKNIANREKHVLQMEKKICLLESENSQCRKQIASSREKLDDCSGTVDYLRREKEQLESEKDRLNYTLLTYEHEIKELRAENVNLVTEYENTEKSRKIALGHLQEIERSNLSEESSTLRNSKKFTDQLSSLKECVQKLRLDREALKEDHGRLGILFEENLKMLLDHFGEMDKESDESLNHSEEMAGEDGEKQVISPVQDITEADDETKEVGEETELDEFRKRLKSNEKSIDQLANDIRDLENMKKDLLESRFAMIQEFQVGREVIDAEESNEESSEEIKLEDPAENGNTKPSNRVTKKIRKLERTLSMDHAVGKLDCIQKLCKKLEDCEQKIQDLETINDDLRAEHDDMEEEAKYLKYVLSYRGDIMKAQLEKQFEIKVEAMKEELRVANETSSGGDPDNRRTFQELSERNRMLEDEVQRLDEELKTLLQSLPAFQGDDEQRQNSVSEGNISQERDEEVVRGLEEKVVHLVEEKRILLMNMQTLTGHRRSRDLASTSSENDLAVPQDFLVLEKSLREIENENSKFLETFQCIRDVLKNDEDVEGSEEHRDSFKISKLKGEIERLSRERAESSRRSSAVEDGVQGEVFASFCARHEGRISELQNEVNRLHDEKKSLLSAIIRLQTDPNFTFSEDVTDDNVSVSCLESPVKDMMQAMQVDDEDGPGASEAISGHSEANGLVSTRLFRDEEVQVNINSQDVGGLLGYLERDLGRLRNALSQQCVVGYQLDAQTNEQSFPVDVGNLNKKIKDLGEHTNVLQEKLDESEEIRSDLHKAISIATDMASEERQKCVDMMQAKTALEKDLLKLGKENRDLRDGLETLSRVRKRRYSRGNSLSASPTSERPEDDGSECYLPRAKSHNYSESEFSDVDSPVPGRLLSPIE